MQVAFFVASQDNVASIWFTPLLVWHADFIKYMAVKMAEPGRSHQNLKNDGTLLLLDTR